MINQCYIFSDIFSYVFELYIIVSSVKFGKVSFSEFLVSIFKMVWEWNGFDFVVIMECDYCFCYFVE